MGKEIDGNNLIKIANLFGLLYVVDNKTKEHVGRFVVVVDNDGKCDVYSKVTVLSSRKPIPLKKDIDVSFQTSDGIIISTLKGGDKLVFRNIWIHEYVAIYSIGGFKTNIPTEFRNCVVHKDVLNRDTYGQEFDANTLIIEGD